jgi:hypothetical protein
MTDLREVLSTKLLRQIYPSDHNNPDIVYHEHWCPGCDAMHLIAVETPFSNGAQWTWDGNAELPTFSPSVNVGPGTAFQCHYFIRAGKIEFCNDCHHALAGQTIDLPNIPEDWLT